MMQDAYSKYAKNFGFMYALNTPEAEIAAIFEDDKGKNTTLQKTCEEVNRKVKVRNIYDLAKGIYIIEYPEGKPLYQSFNEETRQIKSFFEWENFPYRGMWLLLHKALANQKPLSRSMNVYRGVSISFGAEVGQIVSFKQYTSTSSNVNVPYRFIRASRKEMSECTLFDIEIEVGLEMEDFFGYGEEEILLPPYDALQVTEIEEDRNGLRIIRLKQVGSAMIWNFTLMKHAKALSNILLV